METIGQPMVTIQETIRSENWETDGKEAMPEREPVGICRKPWVTIQKAPFWKTVKIYLESIGKLLGCKATTGKPLENDLTINVKQWGMKGVGKPMKTI